ncbi:LysE/ArgO family amino acid transporter [Leucobacter sp. M11]|uniref:LysE/ArgO family amino acid transporter n=1 Tax=Leucobacter sp. M11 TaxID=2993565 RepID=UPI002D7F574F|nr:LysE/ArgO family amino acid transporter [Leucobacter sp. M11]MEB4614789.1 LysE/ArgO family amino acid transporter [Leucobacter sp. M11]
MIISLLVGFGSSISLIAAIGAQNAFVLRQGIRGEHVLPLVLLSALTDAALILLGVVGLGVLIERAPLALDIVRWAGIVFLVGYGLMALWRSRTPQALDAAGEGGGRSLAAVLGAWAAITFLNPHVYLDTVLLLGSIGTAQGEPGKWWFAAGAALASLVWFTALGFGARYLRRFFASPRSWQFLDLGVAVIMFALAARLAFTG